MSAAVGLATFACGVVWADGAFPDSDTILVPADRPQEIILVTNFGLLFSEDDGQTWIWSCEQDVNAFGSYYQMGLPPRRRLHAVANMKALFSDDGACSWSFGQGLLADEDVADVWVDRMTVDRVWALSRALPTGATVQTYSVLESTDGGATYGVRRFMAAPGDPITGVESARSDPKSVYLTISAAGIPAGSPPSPVVMRSSDEGATWQKHELTGTLGNGTLSLLGVDVRDASRVYLIHNGGGLSFIVVPDGGATAIKTLTLSVGVFQAFVQMADGGLIVASQLNDETTLHRSDDGGMTFRELPSPPHVRGLAARAGVLFAATDNTADGYAVEKSTDGGETWTGVMSYAQVTAVSSCMKQQCQDTCGVEVSLDVWPDAVCSTDAPVSTNVDAGASDGANGSSGGAGTGATSGSGGGGAAGGGCGCTVTGRSSRADGHGSDDWGRDAPPVWAIVVAAVVCWRRRPREARPLRRRTAPRRR